MAQAPEALATPSLAQIKLQPYNAEIRLASLALGVDNLRYDVFLSPKFTAQAQKYISDTVRHMANLNLFYGQSKKVTTPQTAVFRKHLGELLQISLTRAKFAQTIEVDLLNRLALHRFLTGEISNQLSNLVVECKDWIASRGVHFEHSEQAHVLRSRITELTADRKNIFRQVGQGLFQIFRDLDEGPLAKSRKALFGEDFHDTYELLKNRLLYTDNGNDDYIFIEHYALFGNFNRDPDRFVVFEELLLGLVRDFVLVDDNSGELSRAQQVYDALLEKARALRSEMGRLEASPEARQPDPDEVFPWPWKRRDAAGEADPMATEVAKTSKDLELEAKLGKLAPEIQAAKQKLTFLLEDSQNRTGSYLNDPGNVRKLMDPSPGGGDEIAPALRAKLLQEWILRLEEHDLLIYVLAGYEVRSIYPDYCPPVHLQQLKKSLVVREDIKRVEQILEQFPARKFSIKRLEEGSRMIRRASQVEIGAAALRFAEDLVKLRRDKRNYQHVMGWVDKIHLVKSENARELSRVNNSLYELVLPEEEKHQSDRVVSHTVIKTDVRGSSEIVRKLMDQGLNPASHFSAHLHEPVKKLLGRHGAAKVFIEGDAIILAIYETETSHTTQRSVAHACVLGREILTVTQAYNERAIARKLPPLEIGVGVAFQNSAPSLWMDGDSKIMISKALNLSDRLSGCSKIARRWLTKNPSPFRLFLLQTVVDDLEEADAEEFMVRFNVNGIELNQDGFNKLSTELSLTETIQTFELPWGREKVELYYGQLPVGTTLEPIVVRKGVVRALLPGMKIGPPRDCNYYEVCTNPKLLEMVQREAQGEDSGEKTVEPANA
jgi:hypothetical protein